MKQSLQNASHDFLEKMTARPSGKGTDREGRQKGLRAIADPGIYRFIRTFFVCALVVFSLPSMGQNITGNNSVCVGASTTLNDATGGGLWSSSDPAIATVDQSSGVVTGVSAGSATISYTVASVYVTVLISVNTLPDPGTISGGTGVCILSSISLTESVSGGVWSTANSIATVSSTGVVTGNAIGADAIQYTVTNSCGSSTASTTVTVNGVVGDIYTYAGTGTAGYSNDGSPAYTAAIDQPRDLTTDAAGNVYFCDVLNSRVRKIARDGTITTVAGNGTTGNSGDGGPATNAALNQPNGVFVDDAGNIFISNTGSNAVLGNTIRKVDASGTITTIAGVYGTTGSSGDGGPATNAKFNLPLGVLEDANGDVYIADQNNSKIRKITMSTGIINTVIGSTSGYSGDNGPATLAQLQTVRGITADNKGNIYIADADNNAIRKYVPSTGIITTFAGNGTAGHTGDGGPATAATINSPARFAYDGANILYITDQGNNVIRQVNLATGIISQVAGVAGTGSYSGDFSSATAGHLKLPAGIAVDHFGNFFIADANNSRIRVVPSTGSIISTLTGPSNVCAGTPISLNSFLSGSGTATYQWQKNGVDVASGTPYTNTNPQNGDVYRVIVSVTPTCGTPFKDTSNDITIMVSPAVSAISGPNPVCIGQTVVMTDTAHGGSWASSAPAIATIGSDGSLTGISAGTTVVTYSLPNVCGTNSANFTVTVNALDTVAASAAPNGAITPNGNVYICNGTSQVFTIAPNPGYHVTDVTVDGTSVGPVTTYTVTAPTSVHTINASGFAPDCTVPTVTSTTSGSVCGAGTVTLTAASSGGTLNWYTASTGGTSLQAGGTYAPSVSSTTTYYVEAADGACVSARTAVIATVNAIPTASATATNVLCYGNSTGSVAVTGAGGTPGYVVTGDATSALSAGTYSYTVTDANGCAATASATVTQPAAPLTIASITPSDISCNPANGGNHGDGSIATSVTGGTGAYAYTWTGGAGGAGGTNPTGLITATYSLTVTDDNGCSTSASATVGQPSVVSVTGITPANVSCNASNGGNHNDGSIATTVTGGSGSYTYLWNNGLTVQNPTGLGTGAYSVTITDGKGCTATAGATVGQPGAISVTAVTPSNVSCNAANGGSHNDGSISVSATGGNGAYSYSWSNGLTFATNTLGSLGTGTYSVTVTDASGCSATGAATIDQPSTLIATASAGSINCNGNATTLTVTGSGGTGSYTGTGSYSVNAGPYSYTISDAKSCIATVSGTVTQPSAVTASAAAGSISCHGGTTTVTVTGSGGTGTLSGTGAFSDGAGTHSYTVTDANGCSATASVTISEPSQVSASVSSGSISCNGGTTTAVVTGSGGTGTLTGPGSFSITAGTYNYTVTDANGCSATASTTATQPAALTLTGTAANAACNGASTGGITTSVSGGTSSYTYVWNTGATTSGLSNLAAGTYSVTVTDAHSCTAKGAYTVGQPSAIAITATPTNVACNGGSTGSITTGVSGGTSGYTYAWSSGATTSGISGKAAGTYSVTVTDAHSCTATGSYTITQPAALAVTGSVTNVGCAGGSTGAVTTTVTGGTSAYTYSWNNGATTSGISSLSVGTYAVTVTDAHSCTATGTYSVTSTGGVTSTITGNSTSLGGTTTTFTGPSGMSSYSWSVSGNDHVCDIQCHHHAGHVCGYGCDHYGHACTPACHHYSGHSCGTSNHTGDHHCNIYCHHNAGHICGVGCDHYGTSCTTNCHHNAGHRCGHDHCGSASIVGSATGSTLNVLNPCCASTYTVTLTVSSGGCSSTATKFDTVVPSAQITAYSCLYTTSSGFYPSVSKNTLPATLKVYDRHICGPMDGSQSHYASVWGSSTGRITNCIISSPVVTYIGGGPTYQYTITVPAGGHYLVVGQSTIPSDRYAGGNCTLYTGQKAGGYDVVDGDDHDNDDDLTSCSSPRVRYHYCLKDNTGKCQVAQTQEQHGSLLLIVSPTSLTFDDSVENLPVIYESVEGEWGVAVSANPPDGFYAIPSDSLSTSVTDSNINAVQFIVADTGSVWTNTKLTHSIQHKGAHRTAYSNPLMVNARTNKLTELVMSPNPTSKNVNIVLPKFEGRATVRIYNMLGQKVGEKKINIDGGLSTNMDVASLPSGVYLVSVENSYSRVTGRLLKQ